MIRPDSVIVALSRPDCGSCDSDRVELVDGQPIYPHRPDLHDRWYWRCECGAYCGTHEGGIKPLGRPADQATRTARQAAHAAFDPLWEARQRKSGISKSKARGLGYKWLADQLGIERKHCHIAEMDEATARRAAAICRAVRQ